MFCSNCGHEVSLQGKFCGRCGASVGTSEPHHESLPRHDVYGRAQQASQAVARKKSPWLLYYGLTILALLILTLSGVYTLVRLYTGETSDEAFRKGASMEGVLKPGKEVVLGSTKETGWVVKAPKNVFHQETTIKGTVAPKDASMVVDPSLGMLVGSTLFLEAENTLGPVVYLEEPMTLTMALPKEAQFQEQDMDQYLVGLWMEDEWMLIHPHVTDLKKGVITFLTDHFTPFGTIKASDEALLKKMAEDYAKREWALGNSVDQVMAKLETTLVDVFRQAGVEKEEDQKKLLHKMKLDVRFSSMVRDLEAGKQVDLSKECANIASDTLLTSKVKFPGSNWIPYVSSVPNLVEGSNQLSRGEYVNAAANYTVGIAKFFPPTKILVSALQGVQLTGILSEDWDRFSSSVAFKAYKAHIGDNGTSMSPKDPEWVLVMVNLHGSMDNARGHAVRAYAKERNMDPKDVEKMMDTERIFEDYSRNLNDVYFKRLQVEKELHAKEADYKKILEALKKGGFFTRGTMGFDSEEPLQHRVDRLLQYRSYILSLFGGEMPIKEIGESKEDHLQEALLKLLQLKGHVPEFLAWLKERGYIDQDLVEEEEAPHGKEENIAGTYKVRMERWRLNEALEYLFNYSTETREWVIRLEDREMTLYDHEGKEKYRGPYDPNTHTFEGEGQGKDASGESYTLHLTVVFESHAVPITAKGSLINPRPSESNYAMDYIFERIGD